MSEFHRAPYFPRPSRDTAGADQLRCQSAYSQDRRGGTNAPAPVIVLANFSDFASAPGTDYVVSTWPGAAPPGKKWIEVTQARDVDPACVGREAIFPWEAKVYTYADI